MKGRDRRSQISVGELKNIERFIERLAEVAERLYSSSASGNVLVDRKPDGSPVTELDINLERAWRGLIRESFPAHSIVGEEYGGVGTQDGYCWYLDPVDGTDDFSRGIPLFGYIAALKYYGTPVAALIGHPALGIRTSALFRRGAKVNGFAVLSLEDSTSEFPAIAIPAMEDFLRESDCSELWLELGRRYPNHRIYRNAYAHTAVLTGALDAAVEFEVAEWDVAATRLLIEEAKGRFVDLQSCDLSSKEPTVTVVFGKADIVDELVSILRRDAIIMRT